MTIELTSANMAATRAALKVDDIALLLDELAV
jgi:hypothetical protein